MEWIWAATVVPLGIGAATLGLAWLETRLLADTGPVRQAPDELGDPAPNPSSPAVHAGANQSLGTTP